MPQKCDTENFSYSSWRQKYHCCTHCQQISLLLFINISDVWNSTIYFRHTGFRPSVQLALCCLWNWKHVSPPDSSASIWSWQISHRGHSLVHSEWHTKIYTKKRICGVYIMLVFNSFGNKESQMVANLPIFPWFPECLFQHQEENTQLYSEW